MYLIWEWSKSVLACSKTMLKDLDIDWNGWWCIQAISTKAVHNGRLLMKPKIPASDARDGNTGVIGSDQYKPQIPVALHVAIFQ